MASRTSPSRITGCSWPHLQHLWDILSSLLPRREQGFVSWLEPGCAGLKCFQPPEHRVPTPALPVWLELPPLQRILPWLRLLRSVRGTGARGGDGGGGQLLKLAQPRYTGWPSNQRWKKNLINYTEPSKILNNHADSGVGEVFFLSAHYSSEAEGVFKGSLLPEEK